MGIIVEDCYTVQGFQGHIEVANGILSFLPRRIELENEPVPFGHLR